MSDLISRLRGWTVVSFPHKTLKKDLREAADEIERLTTQCEGLADAAASNGQALILAEAKVDALTAVVDALKLERIEANAYDQAHARDFTLAQRQTDDALAALAAAEGRPDES